MIIESTKPYDIVIANNFGESVETYRITSQFKVAPAGRETSRCGIADKKIHSIRGDIIQQTQRKKQIVQFIRRCLGLALQHRRCLQGCGNHIKQGRMFCSEVCRHLYNAKTWGDGRLVEDLALPLKKSLKIATNSQNAVRAFRKARRQQKETI